MEKIDDVHFDSFQFYSIIGENAFQFLVFKFFWLYNLIYPYQIDFPVLMKASFMLQKGYFTENFYHNGIHIIDTLQGMHYIYFSGNIRKSLKKEDIFASFIANIIHDYEHPGFSN